MPPAQFRLVGTCSRKIFLFACPSLLGVTPEAPAGLCLHPALPALPAVPSRSPPCTAHCQGNGGIWRVHVQQREPQGLRAEGPGGHPWRAGPRGRSGLPPGA